jgi:radical SAM superfamily enzyme YgiQ (UPF0313 family)
MKLLLVNTNQARMPDPVPPIGLSYLASAVREAGHACTVFDLTFRPAYEDELKAYLRDTRPELIGLSLRNVDNTAYPKTVSFIEGFQEVVRICREASPQTPIVLGGPAFSLFPEQLLEKLGADYGVPGEGEIAFLDLLQALQDGHPPTEKIFHPQGGRQVNLNGLVPSWDLFETDRYFREGGSLNIQTKRGCRYKCSYCS